MRWNPFRRREDDRLQEAARHYASYQLAGAKGDLSQSARRVAIMTSDDIVRRRLDDLLQPVLEKHECPLHATATAKTAVNSLVVLFDIQPPVDARLHGEYDRVLRQKKSMKKFGRDFLAVVGPRRLACNYSRGTYGTLCFFCHDPEHPDQGESDLPAEGQATVEGPVLYDLSCLPAVIDGYLSRHA